jgi:hypothetical protein
MGVLLLSLLVFDAGAERRVPPEAMMVEIVPPAKPRRSKRPMRRHLYWTTAVSEILRDRAAGNMGPLIGEER